MFILNKIVMTYFDIYTQLNVDNFNLNLNLYYAQRQN